MMTITQLQQMLFCIDWVWPAGVVAYYGSSSTKDIEDAIFWTAAWMFCGWGLSVKKRWPFAGLSKR